MKKRKGGKGDWNANKRLPSFVWLELPGSSLFGELERWESEQGPLGGRAGTCLGHLKLKTIRDNVDSAPVVLELGKGPGWREMNSQNHSLGWISTLDPRCKKREVQEPWDSVPSE